MTCFIINKSNGEIQQNLPKEITDLKIIGLLVQSDFDYIRRSNVENLDLSEAEINEVGNDDLEDCSKNSFWCSKLVNVVLPKTLKAIKNNAFSECTSLTSINIPDGVTVIGSNAFFNCVSLVQANIPSSVTSIGSYSFAYCKKLASLVIPSKVTSIEEYAFYDCRSIEIINLPRGVKIGLDAFSIKPHYFQWY